MRGRARRCDPAPGQARPLRTYVVFRLIEMPGFGEPFGCLDAANRGAALEGARHRWPGIAGLRVQAAGSVPVEVLIRALAMDAEERMHGTPEARDVAAGGRSPGHGDRGAGPTRGDVGHASGTEWGGIGGEGGRGGCRDG
ncbi:MAG: hypothetical protein ACYC1S_08125 [Gemmatimonadaceae bacterium]